jgi:hypothetical protein
MLKSNEERMLTESWLDREGNLQLYQLNQGETCDDIASFHNAIVRQHFPNIDIGWSADSIAEDRGWIKLGSPFNGGTPVSKKQPTEQQVVWLYENGYKEGFFVSKTFKLRQLIEDKAWRVGDYYTNLRY